MTHEELSQLYELYALGVLEPEERTELEEHLARNCPQCEAGVRKALEFTALLGTLPDAIEPPKRLRGRILASVGAEPRTGRLWLAALSFAAACLLIGVVVLSLDSMRRGQELADARAEIQRVTSDYSRLQAAMVFLNEAETRQVVFGQGKPQPPRGRVFVNAQRGVLLIASNLPPVPSGRTYEMWLVPKTGAPIPAGLFQSDPQGNVLFLRNQPFDVSKTAAVAVSVEPTSGSPAPTTTPLIAAGLTD